jgi:5-methylcytosine-specific restriction protein A
MTKLNEITPKERPRVIDLVEAAGVDVSDWANCEGGEARAAANPKYCYDWSFVQPRKVIVLNLWHEMMQERDGGIVLRELNMREFASISQGLVKARALKFDEAIQMAVKEKIPVRAIVGDGWKRPADDPSTPSKVSKRLLDPVPWAVTEYDWSSGQCTLTRGVHPTVFVDQFLLREESDEPPGRREMSGLAFVRSREVRIKVLERADGRCEWCGQTGFLTADGRIFLETHHIVSLCDGGSDIESNVAALCPNHHREAHHGANPDKMRTELLTRVLNSTRLRSASMTATTTISLTPKSIP